MSKSPSGSAAWQIAQKNIVQVTFVRWRGDSKIVEANAEHDFRLKRLIGMLRTIAKQVLQHNFFVPYTRRHCRIDLLTPESHKVKKDGLNDHLFKANLFPQIQNRFYAILQIIIG